MKTKVITAWTSSILLVVSQFAFAAKLPKFPVQDVIAKQLQVAPTVNAILKNVKAKASKEHFEFLKKKAERLTSSERSQKIPYQLINEHKLIFNMGQIMVPVETKPGKPEILYINNKPIDLRRQRTISDFWLEVEKTMPHPTKTSKLWNLFFPEALASGWIDALVTAVYAVVAVFTIDTLFGTSLMKGAGDSFKNLFKSPTNTTK